MKRLKLYLSLLALLAVVTLAGCSNQSTRAADVSGSIRTSLDQAGLKDVTVTQDRDKSVVTLGGHVTTDGDKGQAESIARSMAGIQVVANQIAVLPSGAESDAKKVNSDLDKGIESNLHAALIQEKLQDNVKYSVKNNVVTLTGDVDSESRRGQAQEVASTVPNVQRGERVASKKAEGNVIKLATVRDREKGIYALDTRSRFLDFVAFGI
jgi:osmotically-inducible protein OsmY